ncbi:hypothetical protein IFR05_008366 [Cadophora sp. M221]|nr:hypothetical protein IFR05_008366 [Cadophora sp. M221]
MVTHSSATDDRRYDLYPTLKSIHSLLQSTGKVSHELIQAGILISSFEYCQGLFQEAWMSVGACVRMAQILGLQESIRKPLPKERDSRTMLETERCIWWAIVIVERNINSVWKKSKLPCASSPPELDDYLPLTASGEDRLHEDLVLPKDLDQSWSNASLNRDFTRFGSFAATVQSTYLAGLVVQHVQDEKRDAATRQDDAARLEGALQSYLCALIPPASMRIAADLSETVVKPREVIAALLVFALGYTGSPIDFDTLAYWSHRLIPDTAMMHIKFGQRNDEWQAGLDLMKYYLRGIESRYNLYGV